MKSTTIRDVANMAGVSISTVSRVIHGQASVSSEHVAKVNEAIEKLSWHPNSTAQTLRSKQGLTVGLILPNTTDPFFGSIADSVIRNCANQDINVITLVSRQGTQYDEISQFKRLSQIGINGIIYCPISDADLESYAQYFPNTPTVICSRHSLKSNSPHVYFDHQKGGYLATRHLIEMGRSNIALTVGIFGNKFTCAQDLEPFLENPILAGPYSGIDKYIGARQALSDMNIPFDPELLDFIDLGDAYNSGFHAMQRLFSRRTDIDGVVCTNDLSANGAIAMLSQQKIIVPDDISIIGYDNGLMAVCTQPQLSTVAQDTDLLGQSCAASMQILLNGQPCQDVQIDVQLIIRQSSCKKLVPEN